ncbi:hypothetical protein RJT34_03451 [Clitoria ternatea]|uniref:non-specific serine/threonine protein kinase n=1 Tax=Clitoria ternatea TaxID=43366 RepID=A0AAN9KN04_CLITE
MEKYEAMKDIGVGNFAVVRLMRYKDTKDVVAVKYIPRGNKINERVVREIINHRSLCHPNVIRFKEVALTPTDLAVVMEYAAGGELFNRVCSGGLREDEARYFFQQLISGVSYCHDMEICHRDLKLENVLLDGSSAQRLKICDFGYSKSYMLHSRPNSMVGTPAYIAPEILSGKEYDGKLADVWSCGVILYAMLMGTLPFQDKEDPQNVKKTVHRVMTVQYKIPDKVCISQDCKNLISHIFVANPTKRITMKEIKFHPWFLKNWPRELTEGDHDVSYSKENACCSLQSIEDIMNIVNEAKTTLAATSSDQ